MNDLSFIGFGSFHRIYLGIGEYINIYNKERLHSALGYLTPDEAYYQGVNNKSYNARKVLLEVA